MFDEEKSNETDDIMNNSAEETSINAEDGNLGTNLENNAIEEPIFSANEDILSTEETYSEPQTEQGPVTVQAVKFASFEDSNQVHGAPNKNLDILMDIKLQLNVELGKTELPIKKVLELTRGSIISLDKVAGEPVELYANGKLIAHGEVVVIEDNFGLRITSITDPDERLKGIQ